MCAKRANHSGPGAQPNGAPGGGTSAASERLRVCLEATDLLTANALGILVPFLVFRYVMLKAFQTFNLRVSSGELWANLPALVRQDVLIALGIGLVLAVVDLAARDHRRWLSVPLRVVPYITLPLVAVLVAGLYAVYLNLGFFPGLANIGTYLSPGSPLVKTAGAYLTAENTALLAVLILFPLVVKWLCLRYRRPGRGLGLATVIVLTAGWVWPVPDSLTGAAVHPFGQVYDELVHTTPDWDLERWSNRPISYASISGTYAGEEFSELAGAFTGHNILLILIESTARCYLHDRVGGWKYPNLRRLAAAGMDFTRYYTPGDASLPSLFALFAARNPVPLRCSQWYYPTKGRVLWTAELKRRGYRTGFFHSGSFDAFFDRRLFEAMQWDTLEDARAVAFRCGVDPGANVRLGETVDERLTAQRVADWIDRTRSEGRRCLACYFTAIPHLPYDSANQAETAVHRGPGRLTRLQGYENELAYLDAVLGELYDRLVADGFFNDGLLLVTADHGEAFGQHPGVVVHSTHIYQENVHLPLLAVNPQRFEGVVNNNAGSHVDLWPTLAQLLGLDLPAEPRGRSLLAPSNRPMVFLASVENNVKLGVVDGAFKYIYDRRLDRSELFDLQHDPGETDNLAVEHPEQVRTYRDWVHTYVGRALGASGGRRTLALENHVRLGYERLAIGKLGAARAHFAEALEIDRQSVEALLGLGAVLVRQQRPAEAVEVLGRALELDPGRPKLRTIFARALAASGRTDEAIVRLERALQDDPTDADAHECLGLLLLSQGDRTRARQHLEACLAIDPTRASVRQALESE